MPSNYKLAAEASDEERRRVARERSKAWYWTNLERARAHRRDWARRNADSVIRKTRRWEKANPEKVRAQRRAYKKKNRGIFNADQRRRTAAKVNRTPAWADVAKINAIYKRAAEMSSCGIKYHVDHEIPLRGKLVSGLHVPDNLRIIPAEDNMKKHNRFEVA